MNVETAYAPVEFRNMPLEATARDLVLSGIAALEVCERSAVPGQRVCIDEALAALDDRLAACLDHILHDAGFAQLESTWRQVAQLHQACTGAQELQLALLQAKPDELHQMATDPVPLEDGILYGRLYADEYGTYGGEPYAAMVCLHNFGPGERDITVLNHLADVAARAHAPCITNAGGEFVATDGLDGADLTAHFTGPEFHGWHALRRRDEARYLTLAWPKVLLRSPYSPHNRPHDRLVYWENNEAPLWGGAATQLAVCMLRSFASHGWCANILGPNAGGAVARLPAPSAAESSQLTSVSPVQAAVTDRQELALAKAGIAPLTLRKNTNAACFFAAPTAFAAGPFIQDAAGNAAAQDASLEAQLSHILMISRLAHTLKVLQREEIGRFCERLDMEKALQRWLAQYVADMDNPSPGVRARRPLRKANIRVEDVAGESGWFRCALDVQPHGRYAGSEVTLSLVGRLEREG